MINDLIINQRVDPKARNKLHIQLTAKGVIFTMKNSEINIRDPICIS